jgi:hypothetical protein
MKKIMYISADCYIKGTLYGPVSFNPFIQPALQHLFHAWRFTDTLCA